MVGDFLQKLQVARQEFEDGKTVMEILFSSNPGLIRDRVSVPSVPSVPSREVVIPTKTVVTAAETRTRQLEAKRTVEELKRKATVAQKLAQQQQIAKLKAEQATKTARAAEERARVAAERAKARLPEPPTDPFSTFVRGLARVTGAKPAPPRGYEWQYFK